MPLLFTAKNQLDQLVFGSADPEYQPPPPEPEAGAPAQPSYAVTDAGQSSGAGAGQPASGTQQQVQPATQPATQPALGTTADPGAAGQPIGAGQYGVTDQGLGFASSTEDMRTGTWSPGLAAAAQPATAPQMAATSPFAPTPTPSSPWLNMRAAVSDAPAATVRSIMTPSVDPLADERRADANRVAQFQRDNRISGTTSDVTLAGLAAPGTMPRRTGPLIATPEANAAREMNRTRGRVQPTATALGAKLNPTLMRPSTGRYEPYQSGMTDSLGRDGAMLRSTGIAPSTIPTYGALGTSPSTEARDFVQNRRRLNSAFNVDLDQLRGDEDHGFGPDYRVRDLPGGAEVVGFFGNAKDRLGEVERARHISTATAGMDLAGVTPRSPAMDAVAMAARVGYVPGATLEARDRRTPQATTPSTTDDPFASPDRPSRTVPRLDPTQYPWVLTPDGKVTSSVDIGSAISGIGVEGVPPLRVFTTNENGDPFLTAPAFIPKASLDAALQRGERPALLNDAEFDAIVAAGLADDADRGAFVGANIMAPSHWAPYIAEAGDAPMQPAVTFEPVVEAPAVFPAALSSGGGSDWVDYGGGGYRRNSYRSGGGGGGYGGGYSRGGAGGGWSPGTFPSDVFGPDFMSGMRNSPMFAGMFDEGFPFDGEGGDSRSRMGGKMARRRRGRRGRMPTANPRMVRSGRNGASVQNGNVSLMVESPAAQEALAQAMAMRDRKA